MTTAEHALEQKAQQIPPGTFRHTVVLAAKRFKSSWVELGRLLVKVRDEALYEQWGYPNIEAYGLAELRIRKQTMAKLTKSFSFLDRHEPERTRQADIAETAPPFEVVEVLAQAEERGQLSAQEYKSIRDSIWNNERPVSELRREVTEKFAPPESDGPQGQPSVKRLLAQATRLAAELRAHSRVPAAVADRADALVADLDELAKTRARA